MRYAEDLDFTVSRGDSCTRTGFCRQEGKAIAKQNPDFKEGRPKKYSRKQI
jgi:hypothetical protein